ncbi:phosphotransferase [Microbacterium cremeum]|uniref:phosphotransferase n=1 Tax=Microbacterium cremeum TaxID=2782169 RepID=UPI00188888F2|nr:phosphotransferase [Microbacterium cremeum]
MHADALALPTAIAARLVHDQFAPGVEVEDVESAATTNYVFRVGARHSARFPIRPADAEAHRDALVAEGRAMAEFAAASPFPSPRLVFIGRPGFGYPMPWSVQSWIRGDVATEDSVASSSVFARDLAQLIVALRTVDVGGRVFSGSGRGGALTDHDDWVAHCPTRSAGVLPVARLRRAWGDLRSTPPAARQVMSHKDLTPFNLVIDDGRLAGVLDAGGFGPADPALDLVAAWHLLDRDRRAGFRDDIGADDDDWRRGAAWALQQALGLVWYYATTNPSMSRLGRSTIDRILAAPELNL